VVLKGQALEGIVCWYVAGHPDAIADDELPMMALILLAFAAGTAIAAWRSDDTLARVFLVCASLGNLVTFASVFSHRNPTVFQPAPRADALAGESSVPPPLGFTSDVGVWGPSQADAIPPGAEKYGPLAQWEAASKAAIAKREKEQTARWIKDHPLPPPIPAWPVLRNSGAVEGLQQQIDDLQRRVDALEAGQ
jgi:hypothetical protein